MEPQGGVGCVCVAHVVWLGVEGWNVECTGVGLSHYSILTSSEGPLGAVGFSSENLPVSPGLGLG